MNEEKNLEKENNAFINPKLLLYTIAISLCLGVFSYFFFEKKTDKIDVNYINNTSQKILVDFYDLSKLVYNNTRLDRMGWLLEKDDDRNVRLIKGDHTLIIGLDSYVPSLKPYGPSISDREMQEITKFQSHLMLLTQNQDS